MNLQSLKGSPAAPPRLTKQERDERLRETREAIHKFLDEHKSGNSERAYLAGLRYFWAWSWYTWGVTKEEYPVPTQIIEAYVLEQLKGARKTTDSAMLELGVKKKPGPSKLSTIEQRLWALNRAHQEHVKGIDERYVFTPTVRKLLKAARKDGKHRRDKSKALVRPLLLDLIEALDDVEPNRATMLRAMLSVGFAAGGRRVSELVSLSPDDITRQPTDEDPGWRFDLALGKRKTADAADDVKIIPVRGMAAQYLMEWVRLREDLEVEGAPLFRAVRPTGHIQKGISPTWFWKQIKDLALKAGIEGRVTPHSLRAGFATQAVRDGVPIKDAMVMTDHRSFKVFIGYVEAENLRTSEAGALLKKGKE